MRAINAVVLGLAAMPALVAAVAPVTADAAVSAMSPQENFGLNVQLTVDANNRAFLRFDLASVTPVGAVLTRATLTLYVKTLITSGTINISNVCGSWAESSINNSNAPAACSITPNGSFHISSSDQLVAVDLTTIVQSWVSGSLANNGIVLSSGGGAALFDSKESTTISEPARLDLDFSLAGPTGPAGPNGAQGPDGSQGPMGSAGPTGDQGPKGQQGAAGPQGATGNQGSPGPMGLIGDQGPQGAAGPTGNVGPKGLDGQQGPLGPTGPAGPQGPIGSNGPLGPTGPDGPTGPTGDNGISKYNWFHADTTVNGQFTIFVPPVLHTTSVQCPANYKLILGGCGSPSGDTFITVLSNGPDFQNDLDASGQPRDWVCTVANSSLLDAAFRASALCRSP